MRNIITITQITFDGVMQAPRGPAIRRMDNVGIVVDQPNTKDEGQSFEEPHGLNSMRSANRASTSMIGQMNQLYQPGNCLT
jgi:hypothetical protein